VFDDRQISQIYTGSGAVRTLRHGSRQSPAQHVAYKSALELRFQVYCLECNFLSPGDYPDGMEYDEHDDAATHFYAFDARDELVGYVRLVRADPERLFPIQRNCSLSVDRAALPEPSGAAEISRLMVRNDYRRRRGDRLSGVTAGQNQAAFKGDRRHEAPQVLLSLYRQMYAYSCENGIRHWYAAMERPLARSLLRLNFAFRSIGPETDYYGPVAPYVADLRELELQVGERRPELLNWLQAPERWFGPTTHGDEWGLCHISRPTVVVRPDEGGFCAVLGV
jgi:N-acyl amino acid synthase of PEP-CTERM/exosortase system